MRETHDKSGQARGTVGGVFYGPHRDFRILPTVTPEPGTGAPQLDVQFADAILRAGAGPSEGHNARQQ